MAVLFVIEKCNPTGTTVLKVVRFFNKPNPNFKGYQNTSLPIVAVPIPIEKSNPTGIMN